MMNPHFITDSTIISVRRTRNGRYGLSMTFGMGQQYEDYNGNIFSNASTFPIAFYDRKGRTVMSCGSFYDALRAIRRMWSDAQPLFA